jgi:hypothetical protein
MSDIHLVVVISRNGCDGDDGGGGSDGDDGGDDCNSDCR